METLPAELKQHICGLLEYQDLYSIRVVNKTWANIAALHLFEKITITPLSLGRLRLIAQHAVIAICVKCVTFYADLLPSILPEMWHERLILRRRMWTKEEVSFRFQRYVLAYREQQRLRENNLKLNREIIDLSIPMLRRLQRLKLSTGGDSRLRHQIDNGSRPNQQWSKVWFDLRRHAPDERVASRRETEISSQFTDLLNALATSDIHIRELSLTSISTSVWQRGLQLRQEPYCAGLRTLKALFLDTSVFFRHRHLHSTADDHCEVKALGTLLEEAQSLQTLKLHNPGAHYRTDFLQCFRPLLPKLSRLSIFGISTMEQSLIETLQGYHATLTRLDIKSVLLFDSNGGQSLGSWYSFSLRVPESLPSLLDINLADLKYRGPWPISRAKLDSPYLKAVEHAIINGADIPQST